MNKNKLTFRWASAANPLLVARLDAIFQILKKPVWTTTSKKKQELDTPAAVPFSTRLALLNWKQFEIHVPCLVQVSFVCFVLSYPIDKDSLYMASTPNPLENPAENNQQPTWNCSSMALIHQRIGRPSFINKSSETGTPCIKVYLLEIYLRIKPVD